jgi:hypothetical protein
MEILRWTGQPSMALINPIGGRAHVEEWRAALSQYFKIVRVFDAHAASFEARLELLRGFGQLAERGARRSRPRSRRSRASASACTRASRARSPSCSPTCSTYTADAADSRPADADDFRESLEREWKDALRARERAARRAVEQIYGHRAIERDERPFELLEQDLFSVDHWFFWGLNRRQLVARARRRRGGGRRDRRGRARRVAARGRGDRRGGRRRGRVVVERPARAHRVFALPLGGQLLRCGPAASPNFPYVVLGRALYHHARSRAAPTRCAARSRCGDGRRELDRATRTGLAARARPHLRALRRDASDARGRARAALVPIRRVRATAPGAGLGAAMGFYRMDTSPRALGCAADPVRLLPRIAVLGRGALPPPHRGSFGPPGVAVGAEGPASDRRRRSDDQLTVSAL